jgi:hypothetical protein
MKNSVFISKLAMTKLSSYSIFSLMILLDSEISFTDFVLVPILIK